MPELPEVESLRLSLLPHLLGQTVVSARLLRRDMLIASRAGAYSPRRLSAPHALLQTSTITSLQRQGKQLAILARSPHAPSAHPDHALIIQLGMTGAVEFADPAARGPHIHALWTLNNNTHFHFRDPRRFGSLRAFDSIDALHEHWRTLGPDALTISATDLTAALARARRPIKAALLDQSILAGVGNIYADEALFLAAIRPSTIAARLPSSVIALLADSIRSILTAAIVSGGSTIRTYANAAGEPGSYAASHRVYGRAGLPCLSCGRRLSHALLAQRTTVWCPRCQPARR